MSKIDEITNKLQQLNIEQQDLVIQLINEISDNTASTHNSQSIQSRSTAVVEGIYVSSNGIKVTIGDKVRILTTTKTGRRGDTATILHLNKKYVAIKLDKNGSHTQRQASNLFLIRKGTK